jgi:hypothetical protein
VINTSFLHFIYFFLGNQTEHIGVVYFSLFILFFFKKGVLYLCGLRFISFKEGMTTEYCLVYICLGLR